MLNVAGVIAISDSSFKGNQVSSPNSSCGGGGVYLELKEEEESTHQSCDIAEYDFDNCLFIENKATVANPFLSCDDGQFTGVGHGGAISIRLQSYPCHVKITINKCTLAHNSADWGGAVELVTCRAQNNSISFTHTRVYKNSGGSDGGGGIDIEFSGLGTRNNGIIMLNVTFEENSALYGGGVSISTHYAYDQSNNSVYFTNCSWIKNLANYGSAVDIFPAGVLDGWNKRPKVVFTDCVFESNYYTNENITKNIKRHGEGVIMITGFIVTFAGNVIFQNNSGSSIYAISSLTVFDSNVTALFNSNVAEMEQELL